MFDPARPTETLSAFLNFMSKKYLDYKINAKQYVKPAVEYAQVIEVNQYLFCIFIIFAKKTTEKKLVAESSVCVCMYMLCVHFIMEVH